MSTQSHSASRPQPPQHRTPSVRLQALRGASRSLLPAAVLPVQFYQPAIGCDTRQGEVALMHAVLTDALGCFQRRSPPGNKRARRAAQEAEEGIFADDPRWLFSFVNICAVLGLDAEYLRIGLRRWAGQQQAPPKKKRRIPVTSRMIAA